MPVILVETEWPKWLDADSAAEEELLTLLKPCPDEILKTWPMAKAVGSVKNQGSQLLKAVEAELPLG